MDWPTYAGGPRRLFFNPAETQITAANVADLEIKWRFRADAIITASPSVVELDVPGEGRMPIAFIQAWDGNLYALRLRNGTELWRFEAEIQPKPYPNVASVDITEIDGATRVILPAGETVYAIDALTGTQVWRFDAGTGCVDPPGLCAFDGERNEVESSPIVADGKVFFGMDVNDRVGGKGGFYAIDASDGRLVWFFDLESGMTCRPNPGEDIRKYDGYHSEAELGLPSGFFSSRPGCDHPRSGNGCGNVWSSPALDVGRGAVYAASSNCDTDDDPGTDKPPPPMPPYDEAIFALDLDGNPLWRWRPREVDNADLAFGAVPNLFTIDVDVGGTTEARDVVGVGNKDGTYYVIDRDGVNATSGVAWDDPDPSSLPYWATNVVPGGSIGGIIATAAVDEGSERIYFSTGPGFNPLAPQRPTVHALDMTTGAIVWQNTTEQNADASFAPTSAIPGAVFVGTVLGGAVRAYDPDTGDKLAQVTIGFALAAAPAVVDGMIVVGEGVGERNGNPNSQSDITSRFASNITALCVPGTPACERLSPFACYSTRPAGALSFDPIAGVTLSDRFGTTLADVVAPFLLCNPADMDGEDPAIPSDPDHLHGYRIKRAKGEPRFRRIRGIEVANRFGAHTLDLVKPIRLLMRSALSLDDPPGLPAGGRIDDFQCYKVREARGGAPFRKVTDVVLADEFGAVTVDIKKPKRLCLPVNKNGESPGAEMHPDDLLCYRVKKTRGTPRFDKVRGAFVNDGFGPGTVDAVRPQLLCVPSVSTGGPIVTTTTQTTSTTTTVSTMSTTTTTLLLNWTQVQLILDAACSQCHGGGEDRGGLGDLNDFNQGYDNLVGVPSTQLPSMNRVKRSDSTDSYLMHKLDDTHLGVGGSGGPMPPAALLPLADRDGIRAWINAGADK